MLEKARKFIASRQKTDRVEIALKHLLSNHPDIEKVYLTGSYANGDWIDEDTPQWFIDFRKQYKKEGISDVDFYTEPKVESTEHYDIALHKSRGKSILIYDNSEATI